MEFSGGMLSDIEFYDRLIMCRLVVLSIDDTHHVLDNGISVSYLIALSIFRPALQKTYCILTLLFYFLELDKQTVYSV